MRSQRYRGSPAASGAALLLLLPLAALPLSARQDSPATNEQFEDTTSVTVVEVPVSVIHRGEPLDDLTADDFELYDRGERQEILTFERISVDPGAEPETVRGVLTPHARAARRNFLFLFDLAYADARRLDGAAEALQGLMTEGLSPADRVGVAFFSGLRGFQWVVGLTDRHEDAAMALEVMRSVIASDRGRTRQLLEAWQPGPGIRPDGAVPEREQIIAEAGVSSFTRGGGWPAASILRYLVRGLTTMAEATAGLDGQKYLVHLSYGLPNHAVTGGSGQRARVLGQLQDIKRALRTSGWAIHSINLAGLGWGRDSLLMMANDTGGRLFTNSNDVTLLVEEMEVHTRVTYVLAFQPNDLEPDGRYHEIEVRLPDGPRGARLVHRPGYYAPRPE